MSETAQYDKDFEKWYYKYFPPYIHNRKDVAWTACKVAQTKKENTDKDSK